MKRLLAVFLIMVSSIVGAFSQRNEAEREIIRIHMGFDEAFVKSDIDYFERHFAPDYIYSNNFGELFNRRQNLDYLRSFKTKPPFKVLSNRSDNVKVKVVRNAALLTADWTTTVQSIEDPNAYPHTDTGRFTMFYERRGGKWLVVAEHSSEKNHDQKLMEQQILKAGRSYFELIKRLNSGRSYAESERSGDIDALKLLLADEYIYTSRDGVLSNKAEDLLWQKTSQVKLQSAELSEQKVRVISNYSAVETGKISYVGISDGKPFDYTKRYTTTWLWRDFRWQIAADHASGVKN